MTNYEATVADALDQRIADLAHDVRWYKSQPRPAFWRDLRIGADVELRALRNLRRTAQRLAEARPDPIQQYRAYQDWTEAELREAFA
jgi:hypothetical protein